jgi:hydroxymethylbilane synthase
VRIATRGSALALAQARWVAERLDGAELVPIVTSGDRRRAVDDKREWVLELDEALLRGDADLAVHSAKDVPIGRPRGLRIVAASPRANPFDALCGAPSLEALPPGARVGTSSLRRRAQLLARRPDVEAVEIRGNVDTRLRKLADGDVDALILAAAGLERLGREDAIDAVLDFVPAAGQGILLIEARAGDEPPPGLGDEAAWAALHAERAVVGALGADCRSAVGVHAGGGRLRAFVGAADGSAWLTDELEGDDPRALADELAGRLLTAGAEGLLRP